jgi:hypothetical protein
MRRLSLAAVLVFLAADAACGTEIAVRSSEGLRTAVRQAKPGDTVTLMPGKYRGDVYLKEVNGREKAPITIRGVQREKPVLFTGGKQAIHLVDCNYLVLRDFQVGHFSINGINADDGGSFATPSRHVVFEKLTIENTGPKGNHDALKLSGLDDFTVRGCVFRGWGGSGIDMVGCHRGVIEDCSFFGLEGFTQSNAIQMKGGTADILVHKCYFENAGSRAINLGGSTGHQFFRPRVNDYEAKGIVVAGNRFVGSQAAVAWVTADGGHVHHNTIYNPDKWVLRILQETTDLRFKPCHDGIFEKNLVVYDKRVRVFVNVGPNTRPKTFVFKGNAWFQTDGSTNPDLPSHEKGGVYQMDPGLKEPGAPGMTMTSRDPKLEGIGADGYVPAKK